MMSQQLPKMTNLDVNRIVIVLIPQRVVIEIV